MHAPRSMQYIHIHEEPAFTIGIFTMPRGAEIPLHDHPGMTVFSRQGFHSMPGPARQANA